MSKLFQCFFGHTYQLKQVGEAYVKECRICGNQEIVTRCGALGHKWIRTKSRHDYMQTNGFGSHVEWTTETQICAVCNKTREQEI
jgi:hypothetical protein